MFAADERELKALDDFIAYKERCIQRLQHEERNRNAKVEAERLKLYLAEFLRKDRNDEHLSSLFWPSHVSNVTPVERAPLEVVDSPGEENREKTAVDQIVAMLPNAEVRGYFGPRRARPFNQGVRRAQQMERNNIEERAEQGVYDEGNHDPFPPFNPQSDISCGQFVALSIDRAELEAGVPFYIGKVIEDGKSRWRLKMKVCWYWPIMRGGIIDDPGSTAQRYANCLDSLWEPSGESHSWVEKEACIFSWMDESERTMTGACRWRKRNVLGIQVESKIRILQSAKPHVLEYIAMQTEAIDDDRVQAELDII